MITCIAISGYRSLRDVVMPLGQLTVITGPNGVGKTSVYRALRLMADIADDRIIASLAREGGFDSVRWAGPERLSAGMRDGSVPVEGTVRKGPVALRLGLRDDGLNYAVELGLPVPDASMFARDPEIKREVMWLGAKPTPSALLADRRGPSLRVRGHDGMQQARTDLRPYDAALRQLIGAREAPELVGLRNQLAAWRFYDHFRTDPLAPARQPQVGTRTLSLSPDGSDLAAAIQTIREIGDGGALDAAIESAFSGAKVEIAGGRFFELLMRQRGVLRPLAAAELSDGTLRFLLLAAALLSPRPPPLLVFNEPEASLHRDLLGALAGMVSRAAQDTQVIVVSHAGPLVSALLGAGAELVELRKDTGETIAQAGDRPAWVWPAR